MKRTALVFATLLTLATPAYTQCRSRSYGSTYSSYGSYSYPSYSYSPSYYSAPSYSPSYYTPPATYVAPKATYVAPVVKDVKPPYEVKQNDYFLRLTAFFPVFDVPTYGATVYTPVPPPGQLPIPQKPVGDAGQASQIQQLLTQQTQVLTALKDVSTKLGQVELKVNQIDDRVGKLERIRTVIPPPVLPPPVLPKDVLPPKKEPEQAPPPKEEPAKQAQPTKDDKVSQLRKQAILVNQQKCALCHDKGNEQHGGDFVLSIKGQFVMLTPAKREAMQRQINRNKMPPLTNNRSKAHNLTALTDDEKTALFTEMDWQIDQNP